MGLTGATNVAGCRPLHDNSSQCAQLTAGFGLLSKFQDQWAIVHAASQANVVKLATLGDRLVSLEQSSQRQQEAHANLIGGYRSLAQLAGKISSIRGDLEALERSFVQIEQLLVVLKNFRENTDTSRFVAATRAELEARTKEEEKASSARREQLRLDHINRVQEFERSQELELAERRRLLEQAFEEEKRRYLEENKP